MILLVNFLPRQREREREREKELRTTVQLMVLAVTYDKP